MPEQKSSSGPAITTSTFEAPFATEIYPFGAGGLDLRHAADAIAVGDFQIHTNLIHSVDRGVTVRPGLTRYATAGSHHHSVRRLNDPQNSTYTRIWGVDQSLYLGASGSLSLIDAGYSGDPLMLTPHRPPLSGDPWMFVADRLRMRKVRADGLDLPIGLPAPSVAATATPLPQLITPICAFDASDGTTAGTWARFAMHWPHPEIQIGAGAGLATLPNLYDASGFTGNCVNMAGVQTGNGYIAGMMRAFTLDLSTFPDALHTKVEDADEIHFALRINVPVHIEEVRLYFVVGSFQIAGEKFLAGVLPGTIAGINNSAYVHVLKPSDFTNFVAIADTGVNADKAVQATDFTSGFTDLPTQIVTPVSAATFPATDVWVEYGRAGLPLRRGDFLKIGSAGEPGSDWSNVSGIVIAFVVKDASDFTAGVDDLYLEGGYGPDTSEPGSQQYDWRYTHYDPRTGAEGNPSPIMDTTQWLDLVRQRGQVTPTPYGDAAIRQRFYRRGGSNIADWNFLDVNTSDGGAYIDAISDDEAAGAGTVNIDHYEPVPTLNDAGATVLAQPVPVLFGPANGMLFACGDPYRPGHLYWCHPDEPDHWGANNNIEICPPSEELMAGFLYAAQPFVFSRSRLYALYPNLTGATAVAASSTACRRGLVSRTAFTVGLGGVYGVSRDGIFVTNGGLDEVISQDIERLFQNQAWNGYLPVDFTAPLAIRLRIAHDRLYFQYQDTGGTRRMLVYPLAYEKKFWTAYAFQVPIEYLQPDDDGPDATILCGGYASGAAYTHDGFSDDGQPIPWVARTGTWNLGRPREEKRLGDQILDADLQACTVTLQNRLNDETVVNTIQAIDVSTGRQRFIFDSFGVTPQRARNLSIELAGASATARPTLYFLGQSMILEPDVTINRVTQWDDLGHPDESYVTGITLDVDTGGVNRTIVFERDFAGTVSPIATKTVYTDGRHKVKFTWDALPCHKVRIHPNDDCKAWILYKADWIALPEPPRIAGWDIHFEAQGDQYYTGLDLYCATDGLEKQIEVSVDGTILTNPYTLEGFWRITAAGRRWIHLTFLAGRGHVFHFRALDANPGLLYTHTWHTDPEPSEQANWNQNFSDFGTLADKYLKAILFECDTFGIAKQVRVEVDGTLAEIVTVQTSGRLVQQVALTAEHLGRIWRIYPADGNPGRLYSAVPVFDVEPYKLTRWETQALTHGIPGFKILLEAHVTLKSTANVLMEVVTHVNETDRAGQTTVYTDPYPIPATGGVKRMAFVPFVARKGVLHSYRFTSPADFFLYREESHVVVQPWGAASDTLRQMFGNDDLDATRGMTAATIAASRSGGGTP